MLLKLKFEFPLLVLLIFSLLVHAQKEQAVVSSFKKMIEEPVVITVTNIFAVNNNSGHIQGIQLFPFQNKKYAVLTGSSDSYSYYSIMELGDENKVISVNRLMDKPFKHAGGCQIFQNYLAVGIEDNDAKSKSKVCIFEMSNPENPPEKPVVVIERKGEPYRSTAGCVGITKYKDHLLLAVGDWDIKHIDFYSCKFNRIKKDKFKLISSVEMAGISKEGWIDDSWSAYQNINLFTFNDNELYLVGLGQNSSSENVADLFRLSEDEPGKFNFKKIVTKKFDCKKEASFKAAAGVVVSNNNEFSIVSSGYHIENKTFLNYFGNSN
ncbi:MAG TPA: hypothetical protein VKA38_05535 [Draconibacterium sp.]|nr:hypothetical protein [Draconibacterium sp.]